VVYVDQGLVAGYRVPIGHNLVAVADVVDAPVVDEANGRGNPLVQEVLDEAGGVFFGYARLASPRAFEGPVRLALDSAPARAPRPPPPAHPPTPPPAMAPAPAPPKPAVDPADNSSSHLADYHANRGPDARVEVRIDTRPLGEVVFEAVDQPVVDHRVQPAVGRV